MNIVTVYLLIATIACGKYECSSEMIDAENDNNVLMPFFIPTTQLTVGSNEVGDSNENFPRVILLLSPRTYEVN